MKLIFEKIADKLDMIQADLARYQHADKISYNVYLDCHSCFLLIVELICGEVYFGVIRNFKNHYK
jgi:hypothetical protein